MSRHLFLANLAIFVVAYDRGQEIISRGFGSEAPASRHQQSVSLKFARNSATRSLVYKGRGLTLRLSCGYIVNSGSGAQEWREIRDATVSLLAANDEGCQPA